ncbi:chaperonin 10-like protein [Ilyonectria robusta]|uniref:chaperonin 10-like protein n=1 Tax=Ilyonectria robusta TaxID=1079257 RepID=UPI001E8E766B|nr:chaperonin 10-like protein [Ilyonectria robusta]KAH8736555.1 chaperonin 10-like protein [Ilyonectria robusta]
MANTMLQYQATQKGGPFALATVPKPTPEPTDVCIRIKAVALNPLDWKMMSRGEMVQNWPATFGLDASGVVEEVGDLVTAFQPGDEVFALCGIGGKTAGFQEVVTVPQHFVAKKPQACAFEDVAALPICYLTAASAILFGLHVPIPHISPTAPGEPAPTPRSLLVLGGASAVGGAAIQMLRSALPEATILVTASLKHEKRLKWLGASKVVDRNSSSIVSDVTSTVPGGVDAILDCVTAAATHPEVFGALRRDGPRMYSQVFTGQSVMVPDGVQSAVVFGRQVFEAPGGLSAMAALGKLIDEKKYKFPVPTTIVGKGWDAIETGLQQFEMGVSGQKLIVVI